VRLYVVGARLGMTDITAPKQIASDHPPDVRHQRGEPTAADLLAGLAEVAKPEFAELKGPVHPVREHGVNALRQYF
jgi:hypothetical protein